MISEYSVSITMLFDNAADRNTWLAKMKNGFITLKATSPPYKSVVGTKSESLIQDTLSENW